MPNSTMQPTADLRAWALAGAREQLRLIYATFPELRPSPATTAQPTKGANHRPTRKRPKLSAARRKQISAAMRAAWAKRKAEAVGGKGKAKGAR
jgi:hypothetical protein